MAQCTFRKFEALLRGYFQCLQGEQRALHISPIMTLLVTTVDLMCLHVA